MHDQVTELVIVGEWLVLSNNPVIPGEIPFFPHSILIW